GVSCQDFRGDSGRESGQIIQLHRWWELGLSDFDQVGVFIDLAYF
ncbi:MAG: hypothetical protein XD43_1713, partial [Thermococcales archaeon 44_46]